MAGSMETGAKNAADGIASGLGISIMCAGGQGSRSQRGPGVSKHTTERLCRLSGLGGPGGAQEERGDTEGEQGDVQTDTEVKDPRAQGTKPGLKFMSLT